MSNNANTVQVSSASELNDAVKSGDAKHIQIKGAISGISQPLQLKLGVRLEGIAESAALAFEAGQDGIGIAKDNIVENLELKTDPNRSALYLQESSGSFGELKLNNLRVTGVIGLIAEGEGGPGDVVEAKDIHIVAADARSLTKGPVRTLVDMIVTLYMTQALTIIANSR